MGLGLNHYSLNVKSQRSQDGFSDDGLISSNVYVFVYDAGTRTLSTIYSDAIGTAKTNPISRSQFGTDGKIDFFSASTSHDIFINDEKGNCGFYPSVPNTLHTLKLSTDGADKHLVVPFSSLTVETDTTIDLPVDVLVTAVIPEVVTAHSGKTIDIGLLSSETAGDADGLIAAASIAATGFVKPVVSTVGGSETYISTATYGALMGKGSAGTDAANDFGQPGGWGHIVSGSNAKSVVYTCSSSTTTAAGYIHIFFKHLR